MSAIAWAIGGLVAGMLVNLGADVLPDRRPLRSAVRCVHCGTSRPELRWPAWLSFVWARRCANCGAPLSWRALLVELVMGGLWAIGGWRFGGSPWMALLGLHTLVFALVFVIDLEHRLVLNWVVLGGTAVAVGGSLLLQSPPLRQGLLGGVIGLGLFLLIALAKPGGMGMGDVKLAGLIGLVVGYPAVLSSLLAGILVGGMAALVLLLSRRVGRGTYMPYAPFLVVGALVGLFQGAPG